MQELLREARMRKSLVELEAAFSKPCYASVQEKKHRAQAAGVEVLRVVLPDTFERRHQSGSTETVEIVGRAPVWSECKFR
jgi:hypothetical protein